MKKIALLIVVLLFVSCDEFFEDCIFFPAKAEIRTTRIDKVKVGEEYYQEIEGRVKNGHGNFHYSFDVGRVPEGLSYYKLGNKLMLEGKPVESGIYNVSVELIIEEDCYSTIDDDESDCDNICFDNNTAKKNYSLIIEE
ncbi:hypothetical protein [uncultured Tenacibaculum sp.]|uniref:hypothetical protein n=1 Tax=uncultured Tenacibaculum sp. TaxID=174713 RepID=UPI00260E07F9|nr:hypothetical protein [uncultured Tenacibaculum sp.]